ncbi:MAG: 3'-5' exonuclease [Nocardioidaceae bacterium]
MTLTDAGFDLFQRLTARTFLVLDTEYTRDPDGDGDRIISVAVTPVVRGKRVRDGELYREMNPGVAIDPRSTAVHGFTDADVARKRGFRHQAPAVLAALDVPDAVLVCHTGSDIRVLRRELERLDEAKNAGATSVTVGLADLPLLPIIDTSTLPRLLRYPGLGNRNVVSLATLCQLVHATNTDAHHARADARATADALVKLLLHAAGTFAYDDLDTLLADHARGTTHDPKLPGYIRSRPQAPVIPADHLGRHDAPLTHAATPDEQTRWLHLATECVRLRCPHLRVEAALAATENGAALLDPLVALLPTATEPGQAGTLLGAVAALITASTPGCDPAARTPALAHTRALRWWAKLRPQVEATIACEPRHGRCCPDCFDGDGCPRDTLYQPVTRVAVLGQRGTLTHKSIKDRLFGSRPDRRINAWPQTHPRETAYMTWLVWDYLAQTDLVLAGNDYLAVAMRKDLHLLEPRLARVACQVIAESRGLPAAKAVAEKVLDSRTTDPAFDELELWMTWHEQAAVQSSRARAPRTVTHPRLARPEGRLNHNPYLPR